ncbi:hypothetical protein E3N88_43142 [Mikania micrantha]|uniref:Uncharacterized protein n=1 Tax=Mikania micrantha TaxID=192012 RepID=A0A5N6LFR7_9ASTR|nr:hypothetical protein E3N88_43142 [Mikania micrantha]
MEETSSTTQKSMAKAYDSDPMSTDELDVEKLEEQASDLRKLLNRTGLRPIEAFTALGQTIQPSQPPTENRLKLSQPSTQNRTQN